MPRRRSDGHRRMVDGSLRSLSRPPLEVVFMVPPVLTSLVQDAACAVVGAAAVRSIVAAQTADSES
jgi:hypothetical protein